MSSRRSFIKSASLLTAGAFFEPSVFKPATQYIGLQLYTVRDAMQSDPAATLAKVAKIGYNSLEGATYTGSEKFYGMDAAAFSKLLKQNGLIMPSSHYRLGEEKTNNEPVQGTILHGWDKAVDNAAAVGIKYIVKQDELVLGPFQGPVACTRIKKGRGVCGTSWQQSKTLIVPDVEKFPGHIACSSLSKSEIVIPIIKNDEVAGVLDVDSKDYDSFDITDQRYLEKIAEMLTF